MTRTRYLALALALIAAGLALRLGPWHLPLPVHHYGGGLLWGAMLYALVASMRPSPRFCLAATLAVIVAVEASRLVHTPALDAFRLTLPGQLLLGRIFSPWNMVADFAGAALTAALTAWTGTSLAPNAPFCDRRA